MWIALDHSHEPCIWLLYVFPTRDSCTWLMRLSTTYNLCLANSTWEVESIKHLFTIPPKPSFFRSARISYCQYVTYHMTFSIHAKHLPFVCLLVFVLLLGWLFYNFKSFKPNNLASLFRKRNKKLLITFFKLSIKLMARSCACRSPC